MSEAWACRIYPLMYRPDDMSCRDQITIALLGIDTADNVRHARIADIDLLKRFCRCDDEEVGYMNDFIARYFEWDDITYDKMRDRFERLWYPTTNFVGQPIASINSLDETWGHYREKMLRF